MNIEDFYKQAKAWQDAEEEKQRLEAIEYEKRVKAAWDEIFKLAHETFNISPMHVFETRVGQTNEFPSTNSYVTLDVIFDESLKPLVEHSEGILVEGAIRLMFGRKGSGWEVLEYTAHVNHIPQSFKQPYSAFLVVYKPAKVEAKEE